MLPGKQYTPVDYASMAWRHRWLIVIPMIIGLYAGLVVCSRLPNMYQAAMLIQVVPQRIPDAYVRSTVTMLAQSDAAHEAAIESLTKRVERVERKVGITK